MSQSDIHNHDGLPEPIPEQMATMPENFTGESAPQHSQDAKTVESSTESLQDSDSSDVTPEDREWATVNLPNSMNVDQLEVAEEEAEEQVPYPLPLDYQMETIADRIAAQESEAMAERESAEVELWQRIEHLEKVLARYQRSLDEQQLSERTRKAEMEAKITQLQGAREQINQLSQELEVCQEEIQHQEIAIAALSENWQKSQERLAQLERECATTQQRYNQQVQLNLQAANTCRELRARLHRQQRQALQFKAALEKSLTQKESLIDPALERVAPTEYSTQIKSPNDFSTAPSLDEIEDPLEVSPGSVVPKSVPIKPWSNSSESSLSEFGEQPEGIYSGNYEGITPTAFNPESNPESLSTESAEPGDNYPVKLAGSGNIPMSPATSETFWPQEDNLIQTIRDLVSKESGVKAASKSVNHSVSEINPAIEDPWDNTEANITEANITELKDELNDEFTSSSNQNSTVADSDTGSDTGSDTDSEVNLDSYLWDIPEVSDPVSDENDDRQNWPAPVVYPERSIKKRRSLAAVELPRFPSKK